MNRGKSRKYPRANFEVLKKKNKLHNKGFKEQSEMLAKLMHKLESHGAGARILRRNIYRQLIAL